MKRVVKLIVMTIFVALSVVGISASQEEPQIKNVVVFHSYHSDMDWTKEVHKGIVEQIDSQSVELYAEYMDSYRMNTGNYDDVLFQYYNKRYKDIDVDVVVVVDNYAYEFMKVYYTQLFDGVPMLFGGINGFSTSDIFYESSAGIAQSATQIETIELILTLHPGTEQILAVGGDNPTAISEIEALLAVGHQEFDIEVEGLISSDIESQIKELQAYNKATAVIATGSMRNEVGEFYNHSQYSAALIEATGLPVYGMADVYIHDEGAIGGYVINAYDHGQLLGEDINRLLLGESIASIPIIDRPKGQYLFDRKRLEAFDIDQSFLPKDSIILNAKDSSLRVNKVYLIIYSVATFILVFVIILLVSSIKGRKEVEEKLSKQNEILQHMADYDPITNLYNRKYLVDYLKEHLIKTDHYFTAFYNVEITNLKMINDTYGHEIGGKVLKHIASLMKKTYRSDRVCVGIYQSELYVIDSEVENKDLAIKKGQHLISMLVKPIEIDFMDIDIMANIGMSIAPDHTMEAVQLMKKANIALIESIKVGPNKVKMFEDTLYRGILERITLEKQLRRAINFQEFELYYQPKIDIKAMRVNGCEALIRWNHPDGSIVYPGAFIPLAEEVGLIEEIGRWVVKQSVTQVKEWNEKGYDIKLSLNVSGREFDDDFIKNLQHVIGEIGVDPRSLEVEITETAALKDIEHSRALVQTLFNSGLSVSLDDFGTGYSSMMYIKQLKASKLKIDKSFIDNLEDYEQKVVVDSMIQLGRKLDYIINVEGVESKEQLRILKYLDVDEVQGWYFSKALPSEAFIEYVDNFYEEE